jgi:hypothetical protein
LGPVLEKVETATWALKGADNNLSPGLCRRVQHIGPSFSERPASNLAIIEKLGATQCQGKAGAFHVVLKFNTNNLSFYYYYF